MKQDTVIVDAAEGVLRVRMNALANRMQKSTPCVKPALKHVVQLHTSPSSPAPITAAPRPAHKP